jgi:C4-dicarboxylate transporter DctQ subunit
MFVWMAKVRRRVWRAHRHPRRRRRADQPADERTRAKFIVFGLLAGAAFTAIVGTLGATFVWENGAHHAIFKLLGLATGDLPKARRRPTSRRRPGSSTRRFRSART